MLNINRKGKTTGDEIVDKLSKKKKWFEFIL